MVTEAQRQRTEAVLKRRPDRLPLGRTTSRVSLEPVLGSSVDDGIAMFDVLSDEVRPQPAEATPERQRVDVARHFPARSLGDRRAEVRGATTSPARRRAETPLTASDFGHWL